MVGCSTTGRGAHDSTTDADVALQSTYTWTMHELGADGVTFAGLQYHDVPVRRALVVPWTMYRYLKSHRRLQMVLHHPPT